MFCSSGVFISPDSQRPMSAAGSMSGASTVLVDQFEPTDGLPSESTPQKVSRRNSSVLGEFAEWQLL